MSSSGASSDRKLAAILFADIVGYTAMMQSDEGQAMSRLERYQQVLESNVTLFNGEIVKNYGDGSLCLFNSVLDAVRCAYSVQEQLREEPQVPLRIGLHLGDIMFRKDDIYGDAINIASRIESMGVPGAVLLSNEVHGKVKNQADLLFQSLGEYQFKNVEAAIEVFALANGGLTVPKKEDIKGKFTADTPTLLPKWFFPIVLIIMTLALLEYWNITSFSSYFSNSEQVQSNNSKASSLAVLPFRNLSPDQENQFFCDGVTEAVLSNLSKISGLKVIARSTIEQYKNTTKNISVIARELGVTNIIEGSVQRSGNKVRITTQLVDPDTKEQIWSDVYDSDLDDIFGIQSEIAENIAKKLMIDLTPQSEAILASLPVHNIAAYDQYLKGKEILNRYTYSRDEQDYRQAVFHFEESLKLDSTIAESFVGLGNAFWRRNWRETVLEETFLDTARMYYEKALAINDNLPEAHSQLGRYYLFHLDSERFLEHQLKAITIDENYAPAYWQLGGYHQRKFEASSYIQSIQFFNKAIELDPFSPNTPEYYNQLCWIYIHLNAFEEAEYYGKKASEFGEYSIWFQLNHLYLIQGKYDLAEQVIQEWKTSSTDTDRAMAEIIMNRDKDYKKAIALFEKHASENPNQIDYRQRWGLAYYLDGQKEKGEELLLQALEQYEKHLELRGTTHLYDIVGIYAFLGQTDKAFEILEDPERVFWGGLETYSAIDPLFQNLWDNEKFKANIQNRLKAKKEILRQVRAATLSN
ncbi:MAG: hypothetical protein KJP00_03375 [Bacteroidia bacterium]|nr:hypothetical protein [Bacteroidia bacterium]